MKNYKRAVIVALGVFVAVYAKAQENWMLHVNTLHQSYLNPAFQTSKKWEVSAASLGGDFQMGKLSLGDFIKNNGNGTNVVSLNQLAAAIDEKNDVGIYGSFNSFDLALRMGGLTLTGGHSIQYEFSSTLNPDLIKIAANGNEAYIGQTVELGMPLNGSVYQKMYLGVAGSMGIFNWGIRAAYLNGWHHLHTEKMSSLLTTGSDYYELTIANDIEIYNAGILDYNAVDDIAVIKGVNDYRSFFTANHGLSLDLGIELKINEESGFIANLQNLGTIKWQDRAQRLSNQSTTMLRGVNLEQVIDGEETESIEDSLLSAYELKEENLVFSRRLNPRFNVGGYFTLASTQFSAILNVQRYAEVNHPSLFLQASKPLSKMLTLGVNYHWQKQAPFNLGFMAGIKLGPVNAFAACNNAWALLHPASLNGLSGRIGATVGF